MEILGVSHPAVSKAASISQKLQELSREAETGSVTDSVRTSANQAESSIAPDAANAAPATTVTPSQATSESLLEARKPVDPHDTPSEGVSKLPDEDDTKYEFPEDLPMSFEEMVDMLRKDPVSSADDNVSYGDAGSYGDGLSLAEPAEAGEAVRFNRTA